MAEYHGKPIILIIETFMPTEYGRRKLGDSEYTSGHGFFAKKHDPNGTIWGSEAFRESTGERFDPIEYTATIKHNFMIHEYKPLIGGPYPFEKEWVKKVFADYPETPFIIVASYSRSAPIYDKRAYEYRTYEAQGSSQKRSLCPIRWD